MTIETQSDHRRHIHGLQMRVDGPVTAHEDSDAVMDMHPEVGKRTLGGDTSVLTEANRRFQASTAEASDTGNGLLQAPFSAASSSTSYGSSGSRPARKSSMRATSGITRTSETQSLDKYSSVEGHVLTYRRGASRVWRGAHDGWR